MSPQTGVRVHAAGGGAGDAGAPPCVLCILGVSGDLATGKLLPALGRLAAAGALPRRFAVLGCARELGDDELRARVDGALRAHVHACAGNFDEPAFYRELGARLEALESGLGARANRIFYLATPPGVFPRVVAHLTDSGLLEHAEREGAGHGRVVVEKPFGHDLESARELNRFLAARLREDQIFRIDHYLAKDTVQNILVLRYANLVFEPLWGRHYVDHVQITAAESIGVQDRGRFYDRVGVVRDIFQNHLLQLLALVAMESPVSFAPEDIRQAKLDLLRSLRPLGDRDLDAGLVLGQYEGYRDEPDIGRDSRTATYVAEELRIDNWRWEGVPFYLRTGKALAAKRTEISLVFRSVPHCLFASAPTCGRLEPNALTLRIQPAEGLHLGFMCKQPGHGVEVAQVEMDMGYAEAFARPILEAYERVLLDAMRGDQTLFMRDDEVEAAWRFVAPVLAAADERAPVTYPRAGEGPAAADALLARAGRRWVPIASAAPAPIAGPGERRM